MDSFQFLLNGFAVALEPANLFYTFVGVFLGTIIGVLPGLGAGVTIALLIPVTIGLPPGSALMMMCGVYYGAQYGGSTTAILINTPGEATSMITCIDGYQMAKQGRAGAALAIAAWGSFIAGTLGVLAMTLLAEPLARFAFKFGPAEYFSLSIFAMTAVSALTGRSPAKALIATILGLMIGMIGIDPQSGMQRFTFGIPDLQDGIGLVLVVIGLFAVAEVLVSLEQLRGGTVGIIPLAGKLLVTLDEWRRSILPIFRGGVIGFSVGVLPGAGGTVATILSYACEKKLSPEPERFGKGAIEGVAGPESANNAASVGALVPMLTLGIPGSGAAAILMGVLIMYNIQPGPFLFRDHPDVGWGVIASMYIGNVMLLILNLPLVALFVRFLYTPLGILFPLILVISALGVYGVNASIFELYLLLAFGVLGYLFRKLDIPAAPLVLALVLAANLEQSFRQALTLSGGSPAIFFGSALSSTLLIAGIGFFTLSIVLPKFRSWRGKAAETA